jgi:hypothetical protein
VINYKVKVSVLLALVVMSLAHVTNSMTNAVSQDLNTTSNTTIEDRIERIMGNRITKLMDDTIDMVKNANTTVITNQSENGIIPVTNVTDVNKVGVKSIDKLEKLTGKNTALELGNNSSIDSPNASMSLEEMEKSPENAIINKQDTTAFEGQNISSTSTVNTTENTSSSDINQKIMNDDADNNKTLATTTTNKPTSRNDVENFFTQIGEAVKKFFGDN